MTKLSLISYIILCFKCLRASRDFLDLNSRKPPIEALQFRIIPRFFWGQILGGLSRRESEESVVGGGTSLGVGQ